MHTGSVDFDRQLTKTGRWQAVSAAKAFGRSLRPFTPVALASPAPRALETAELFLDEAASDVTIETHASLYDGTIAARKPRPYSLDARSARSIGTMQPDGAALFRELGYAPLREYLPAGEAVLGAYARDAAGLVAGALTSEADAPPPQKRRTLVLVAHAIYLPAAALHVAEALGSDDATPILDTNTAEAEGFLIEPDGAVSLLTRPK